jgi:hypothetical protein
VHAYCDGRGRLLAHRYVDVSTIAQVPTPQGPFPLVHALRDADVRDVADLSAELREIKADPAPRRRPTNARRFRVATHILGLVRTLYLALSRSVRLAQLLIRLDLGDASWVGACLGARGIEWAAVGASATTK